MRNLGKSVLETAKKLRLALVNMGYNVGNSNSQIIPIITGSRESALRLSKMLRDSGVIAPAIRPPTVPEGESRVRISLNLSINDEELERLILIFKEVR
jgi:8-amino-7-oxononanoate synthase